MKKIVCLLIVLLAIAACKPTAPVSDVTPSVPEPAKTPEPQVTPTTPVEPAPEVTPTAAPVTTPTPAVTPGVPNPAPEPQVTPTKPATTETSSATNPKLRDLLKRADEKVKSVSYLYGGSETGNLFLDTYQLKSDKMKIKRYEENYYVREGYYDTVYVNDAIGCCEKLSRCKSHNVDNMNKPLPVDTSTLTIPKTPYQWLKEVNTGAIIVGPETFNERSVTHVKFTSGNNQPVDMWIDDTYGLPHKVIVTDKNGNEIKYQFNDLEFNSLKDEDFVPPCKTK